MTEKEKNMLCILKDIAYYSKKLDSLVEDLEELTEEIEECKQKLEEKRQEFNEV